MKANGSEGNEDEGEDERDTAQSAKRDKQIYARGLIPKYF